MVRIVPGSSWKLNPAYLAGLSRVTGRSRQLPAVLDALGIEVDGVNVSQGLSEAALFQVVEGLAAIVARLCRDPLAGGQVALNEGATELVLGRRGGQASLCVVSLARPARVLAGEFEVELGDLAQATADCVEALLEDLRDVGEALLRTHYARGLSRHAQLLRKAARLSGKRGQKRPAHEPLAHEPALPSEPDVPSLGFSLFDEEGRIDSYRRGGELYSLLGQGEVFLRDVRGAPLALAKAPPFLVLTDLARAAGDLVEAAVGGERTWEGELSPGGSRLKLDLPGSLLTVEGRVVACRPLQLARSFLQAALDFGGAIVARNPGQAKNPYLSALLEGARERASHLREVEGGDVYAASSRSGRAAKPTPTGAPLGTGTLKRLRFRVGWRGVDTGTRPRAVRLAGGTLVTVGERRVTFLDAASGRLLSRRNADAAAFCEQGVLLSDRSRLLGLGWRGEGRFLRDLPGHDQPPLAGAAGPVRAGSPLAPATLCVFEGGHVAALLAATGRPAWHFRAPQAGRVSVAVAGERVYVAADNGFLYALEAGSGQVAFRVRGNCTYEGPVAVGCSLATSLGRLDDGLWLAAVDAATGRPQVSRALPLRTAGGPLPFRHRLLVGGMADGESCVLAVSPAGKDVFRTPLGSAAGVPALLTASGRIFAALRDGSVCCLSTAGRVLWKAPPCGLELDHPLPPVIRRGVLLAAGDPIRALDPATGAVLCELPPSQGLSALAVGTKLDVHAIDDDGVAACFLLATHLSVV